MDKVYSITIDDDIFMGIGDELPKTTINFKHGKDADAAVRMKYWLEHQGRKRRRLQEKNNWSDEEQMRYIYENDDWDQFIL